MSRRAFMFLGLLCAHVALFVPAPAGAAITCTASVTSVSIVYDPNAGAQNITTGSYTVTCTRLATDPNTFAWRLGVNNGLQQQGQNNRVATCPVQQCQQVG